MEKKEKNIDNDVSNELILNALENVKSQIAIITDLYNISMQNKKPKKKEKNYKNMSKEELIELLEESNIEAENTKLTYQLQKNVETKKRKFSYEVAQINSKKFDIVKIVFTGGPCAGKTTAITTVADKLRENGFQVFIIPEAASMIFTSGGDLNLENYSDSDKVKFQFFLLMLQMSLEDIYAGLATTNEDRGNIILLCDRGTMDGSAYMSKKLWNTLLNDFDLNEEKIRDKRYDLIIHLSTSADGAEKYYTNENNEARHESVNFARILDMNLQEAWIKHPNFVQINNKDFSCFNDKISQVVKSVFHFLCLPEEIKFYKKFIISNPNNNLIELFQKRNPGIKIQEFDISDVVFYKGLQNWTYFRKRKTKNTKTFVKCDKFKTNEAFREKRRQISYREYRSAKEIFSKNKYRIKKKRNTFMWNKKYFVLDTMNIDGIIFSVCVVNTNENDIKKLMPLIFEKNIIKEVSKEYVSIFSELIAQNNNAKTTLTSDYIDEDLKSKMLLFKE